MSQQRYFRCDIHEDVQADWRNWSHERAPTPYTFRRILYSLSCLSVIDCLLLPSRDLAEIPLKRRKSSIQPTNQPTKSNVTVTKNRHGATLFTVGPKNRTLSFRTLIHELEHSTLLLRFYYYPLYPGEVAVPHFYCYLNKCSMHLHEICMVLVYEVDMKS